jgi:hypothetical protein
MKPSIWYLAVVVVAGLIMHSAKAQWYDSLSNRRCPVCVQKGYKTKLYVGGTTTTLMAAVPFYDENGKYNYNDPNWSTTSYHCSSGHTFSVSSSGTNQNVSITSSNDVRAEVGAYGMPWGSFINAHSNTTTNGWVVTNLTSNTDLTISSVNMGTNANYILSSGTTTLEFVNFFMCTGEVSRANSIYISGVEFGTSNGVLYVDPHGRSMTEAASNVLKFVVEQYKEMGYKLTQ